MKVTDYIVLFLKRNGVKTIFGYQGSSISHMIDSLENNSDMEFIETRHEQAAAFAANGYAETTGRLGVAIACSGPGGINLLGGIANAYYDSLPCLFITGQVSVREMRQTTSIRQRGFQETDIVNIVAPIVKYAVTVYKPDEIPVVLQRAIIEATSGRPGPVVLDIPHNVQNSQFEPFWPEVLSVASQGDNCVEAVKKAIQLLNNARRPLIILGGGAVSAGRTSVSFFENLKIPVVTSFRGKNALDNKNICYCGTIGVYGNRYANWAVKYCDFVLVIGSRLDGRQTGGEPLQVSVDTNVMVVDIDLPELEQMPEEYQKIWADASDFVFELAYHAKTINAKEKWLNLVRSWVERYPAKDEYKIEEKVNPNLFLHLLSEAATKDAVFTTDVGQNQLWTNTSLLVKKDQILLQSCGLGSMGFALPAAIGGYYAQRSQLICICGDGGFQMNMQELQTVQSQEIPIKLFVLDNCGLGLIRDYQEKALEKRYYGSVLGFGSPDYEKIAQAYGMQYRKVTKNCKPEELNTILKDPRAFLVQVEISEHSTAFPELAYQKKILEQSLPISEKERRAIEEDIHAIG